MNLVDIVEWIAHWIGPLLCLMCLYGYPHLYLHQHVVDATL